jgi:hypothetical protein
LMRHLVLRARRRRSNEGSDDNAVGKPALKLSLLYAAICSSREAVADWTAVINVSSLCLSIDDRRNLILFDFDA